MKRPRTSLAIGVGRDLLLAIGACAIAVLAALSIQLRLTEHELREGSLEAAAVYVDRHLRVGPDGTVSLPVVAGSSWATFGYPTLVFDRAGQLVFKQPAELDPTFIAALYGQRPIDGADPAGRRAIRFFNLSFGDEAIIGAALRSEGGARLIEIFKDENAPDVLIDDIVRQFPVRSLWILLPVFGLLAIAGGGILWRRIRPITEVSALAGQIGPAALDLRLPEESLPVEVQPIVRAVNGALARLETAADAQREFLRRAAHQLRTPLTVLLGDGEAAVQLRRDIKQFAEVLGQLLQFNELDALPSNSTAIADLAAVGEAVRGELGAAAATRSIIIELNRPADPVLVKGDPNVIEVAVRNLVENAVNAAPRGSMVRIEVGGGDGEIAVSDAGPGVPRELRDSVFEPFWSGDKNGARAGLGLTIVRRIADRYAATVTIGDAVGGGAVFALRFHRVTDDAGGDPARLAGALPAGLARQRENARADAAAG